MSNLLKSYTVVCNGEDKRIIDSNKAMSDTMVKIKEQLNLSDDRGGINQNDFVQGLAAENVEELLYSENNDEGETVVSGNIIRQADTESDNQDFAVIRENEELFEASKSQAEESAKYIIENAQGDAEAIIADAKQRAEEILEAAKSSGYEQGYSEGKKAADGEITARLNDIEEMKKQLQAEYEEKKRNIEPELVDTILKVFAKVTHVLSEDKKGLIIDLVDSVMNQNPLSNNFFVRTSKEDAEFLRANKEKLMSGASKNLNLEIVEDSTMKRNECMVETDFGIFDCSLDIQLEGLIQDIKILACAVGNE